MNEREGDIRPSNTERRLPPFLYPLHPLYSWESSCQSVVPGI